MRADVAVVCVSVFVIAVAFHLLPRFWRPTLLFGVTVPEGFRASPEARQALKRYRTRLWLWTAASMALLLAAARFVTGPSVHAACTLLLIAGAFHAFRSASRIVKPFAVRPAAVRRAGLAPAPGMPGGILSWLLPFVAIAAAMAYLNGRWDDLPARFPVHWALDGRPDRWSTKSFHDVYAPLAIGLCTMLSIFGTALVIQYGTRISGSPHEKPARFRRAVLRLLLATMWLMAALFIYVSAFPFIAGPDGSLPAPAWLLPIAIFAVIAAFAIPTFKISQEPGGADPMPDEYWRLGDFYFNKDDPALMVERRFGIGYTINLANKRAVAVFAALILLPVIAALLIV